MCKYIAYRLQPASPVNTRFAVAVHILSFLETQRGEPVTSELLAGSVGTNPSLIRGLLSRLAKAGLTTAKMGTGGGALLARPADTITLLDVYRALDEERDVIPLHPGPNPRCPVGRNIHTVLEGRFGAAAQALERELARTTIADLGRDLTDRVRPQAGGGGSATT